MVGYSIVVGFLRNISLNVVEIGTDVVIGVLNDVCPMLFERAVVSGSLNSSSFCVTVFVTAALVAEVVVAVDGPGTVGSVNDMAGPETAAVIDFAVALTLVVFCGRELAVVAIFRELAAASLVP